MDEQDFTDLYKSIFIENLRKFRNERNISAREMSLSLGQNVNYINLIENGKRLPSMQGFFLICEYLKVSPHVFFESMDSEKLQQFEGDSREARNIEEFCSDIKKLSDTEFTILKKMLHALV